MKIRDLILTVETIHAPQTGRMVAVFNRPARQSGLPMTFKFHHFYETDDE